jgi:hypothetical protein
MIKLLNIIFLSALLFRNDNNISDKQTFNYYKQLNDSETRLQDFRDNDEALRLKLTQLDIINTSRKKYKTQPVELDILASRIYIALEYGRREALPPVRFCRRI